MRRTVTCCVLAFLLPASIAAQSTPGGERLTLDAAIRLAIESNRSLQTARLQVEKADEDLAAAKTRRLPSVSTEVVASQLLMPATFSFPQGAFGTDPLIGPIPGADTDVTTPRSPTLFVSAQIAQPLSQLTRINLGIRSAATARDIDRERARAQQLAVVNAVKRLYFAIQQSESALTAAEDAISLYRELDRTLQVRVEQRVALRSDALDVQFRLAEEELQRTRLRNAWLSQKEQLNQLLGRDVRTAFDIEAEPASSITEVDLEAAQARALERRPDVQEARLKLQQAELDRRLTKANRIPDVSLAASYASHFNIDVLPASLAAVGIHVKWELFDWGRKARELAGKSRVCEQARLAVRDAEDRAVLEITSRYRSLTEARALLNVAYLARQAAGERLRVRTNQFQVQAALLSDVLQLRADLAASTHRYHEALLAFWTARADFDLAIGEDVMP